MDKNKEKAIIICSGGLDSITLLYWAHQKYDVEALNFKYGSIHNDRESEFVDYHCKKLGIPYNKIELDFTKWGFESSLLKNSDEKIPEGHYSDDSMKSTVVSFRNAIMLSIATGIAESKKAQYVLLGSHKGDRSNYPDCSREFTTAMNLAAQLGTYTHVNILSPFNDIMKWDILKIGLGFNIEYDKTWSCYKGGAKPCIDELCGTCFERVEAFKINGIRDPLLKPDEWGRALKYIEAKNDKPYFMEK